jgi:CheY-like chemotaxis protein/anti-sigma regulatory factor (Ser/Thr protein kinase)
MQPVDLLTVSISAMDVLSPAIDAKRIELRKSLDPSIKRVLGDPDRLQQIIWNLLSNAAKFTEADGTIDVRLEQVGRYARITIADTGKGIEPEFLPYIFDRFRQADSSSSRREGGLGLGLALVRELVELHGGTVQVQSAGAGKGSTFTLEFPTVMSPEFRQNHLDAASQGVVDARALEGMHVLVVEDEEDARALISTILLDRRAKVTAFPSCGDALAFLRTAGPDGLPDVLVSDIGMAREDGYHLIRQIRELPSDRGGTLPAVAVTGYAGPEDRTRALQAGYHGHVPKPVDPVALTAAIAQAVNHTQRSTGPETTR